MLFWLFMADEARDERRDRVLRDFLDRIWMVWGESLGRLNGAGLAFGVRFWGDEK